MLSEQTNITELISGKWQSKRYYSLEAFLKNQYGHRIKKIAIDAGFTCPNRDGTLDSRGCIFCSAGGSGDFAVPPDCVVSAEPYIAYFQAYTCTYAPVSVLEPLYRRALEAPMTAGISIGTRPDCLPPEVLALLARLRQDYPHKFIWLELGLQTIHEATAAYIRRGYPLSCFTQTISALHAIDIPVIVHVILGLPGETETMMLETIQFLNTLPVFGVKLQLLHVLRGTDLALDYADGSFKVLTMEEYIQLLIHCIEQLAPHIVLHRVTGDGPKELLLAPLWSMDKKRVLNTLHHQMKLQNSYQGKYWKGATQHVTGTPDSL